MNTGRMTTLRAGLLRGTELALVASALAFASLASAQVAPTTTGPADQPLGAAAAENAAAENDAAEIVVTGSRIRRDSFDASTPVSVVSAEEVTLTGTINVEDLLGDQPQFVASANGGRTGNAVPAGTAQVNLRGFGSARNLVLVNGRRFAIFGPEQITDLNTIPAALIARTEVVTGGSSAVYGSDAITGVTNFIIRQDFDGIEARSQFSIDRPTGTPNYSADLTFGKNFGDGRGNFAISANYLKRNGVTRGERGGFAGVPLGEGCVVPGTGSSDSAGTPLVGANVGNCVARGGQLGFVFSGSGDIPTGRFSNLPIPGSRGGSAGSNPALDAAYAAAGLSGLTGFGLTFDGNTARLARDPEDRYNLINQNYLVIPQERYMVNGFGHYEFADALTGYLEVHYSDNRVDAQLSPSNLSTGTLFNTNNPFLSPSLREVLRQLDARETATTTVVAGPASFTNSPNDGLALINAGRRYVEVGNRQANSRRKTFRTAIGVRGDIGDLSGGFLQNLNYDVYYSYAESKETLKLFNAISRSGIQRSVLSVNGAAPVCNIFGSNIDEKCAAAIRANATNRTEAELQVAAANISGDLLQLPAGALGFSLGTEWRRSSAKYSPDVPLSSGDIAGFNPGLPTQGSVTVKEVFGEVRVPILRDVPFIKSLTANGAFRMSDYSLKGVGTVWTYLGGLEWEVSNDLKLRAQYQRAIRAPSVAELFGGTRRQVGNATDPCSSRAPVAQQTAAVRALCVATGVPADQVFTAALQPEAIIPFDEGGNPNLGQEDSDTYTAGFVVTPRAIPGFRLSVDYFNIKLKGAVGQRGGGIQNTLNLCYTILQDASSDFCQAVRRDRANGQINSQNAVQVLNANTGSLETSGIDFAAQYSFDLGFGVFEDTSSLSLSTNWTWTSEQVSTPVAAFPNIKNDCVGAFGGVCGEPFAEFRGNSRLTWDVGPASISLRHRYIDGVTIDRVIVAQRRGDATVPTLDSIPYPKLPAQHYFDLSFTATVMKRLEIFGGVNNLLNNDVPGSTNPYFATYDPLGQEFFIGAIVKF